MQNEKISSDGSTLVNPSVVWTKITDECRPPTGVKLLLINKSDGCTTIGFYDPKTNHFTHYAGFPKFAD